MGKPVVRRAMCDTAVHHRRNAVCRWDPLIRTRWHGKSMEVPGRVTHGRAWMEPLIEWASSSWTSHQQDRGSPMLNGEDRIVLSLEPGGTGGVPPIKGLSNPKRGGKRARNVESLRVRPTGRMGTTVGCPGN
jgi:hypothetical protein